MTGWLMMGCLQQRSSDTGGSRELKPKPASGKQLTSQLVNKILFPYMTATHTHTHTTPMSSKKKLKLQIFLWKNHLFIQENVGLFLQTTFRTSWVFCYCNLQPCVCVCSAFVLSSKSVQHPSVNYGKTIFLKFQDEGFQVDVRQHCWQRWLSPSMICCLKC